jgi:RNA polymerase sigma-B factor
VNARPEQGSGFGGRPFDPDAERWLADALARHAETRDPHLRAEIAEATSWLAHRAARRFAGRGEPFDDLLQVARIGLLKAIDRYDPSFGAHFAAYGTPTIVGELRRHFRDHTWSVHVSRRAKDLRPAVNKAVDELSHELGRSPRMEEIAQRVGASVDAIVEALEANGVYRTSSLDGARAAVASGLDPDFEHVLDKDLVELLMGRLQPRERKILHLRFFEQMSQSQIAERIGTSQVHVGRLLASTLTQLRALLEEAVEQVPDAVTTAPRARGR